MIAHLIQAGWTRQEIFPGLAAPQWKLLSPRYIIENCSDIIYRYHEWSWQEGLNLSLPHEAKRRLTKQCRTTNRTLGGGAWQEINMFGRSHLSTSALLSRTIVRIGRVVDGAASGGFVNSSRQLKGEIWVPTCVAGFLVNKHGGWSVDTCALAFTSNLSRHITLAREFPDPNGRGT